MKRSRVTILLLLAVVFAWGGRFVYRAWMDIVSLNVRNMDVREVISKLEWRTWETILVNKDVRGLVTLDVKDVPLEEVLNIIALQTSSRWTALFPIYISGKSEKSFERVVRGEIPASSVGWSSFDKVPSWKQGGGAGFGATLRAENKVVSAQLLGKDLDFAALALSRFSQARVIPEDNAKGMVNLRFEQIPLRKAVAKLASQVHKKWDQVYALQAHKSSMVVVKNEIVGPKQDRVVVTDKPMLVNETNELKVARVAAPPKMEEKPEDRERQMEAFMATMSPEEKQKIQEQMNAMEQMRNLPPEEQKQRMQEMAAQASQTSQDNLEQRINNRLKNGTIEQRLAHDRNELKRQQQRQTAKGN